MDYRSLPRIANSDLTEFKNWLLFGRSPKPATAAMGFGTQFHQVSLLGESYTGKGATQMGRMLTQLQTLPIFSQLLSSGLTELVTVWDDAQTGLPCKGRLDLIAPPIGIIADLKTTSAKNQLDFERQCVHWEYDRQGAFYLDGCRSAGILVNTFILIGVQKQKPNQTFVFESSLTSPFIEQGRKRYRALLRSWQQRPYQPTSWINNLTPSSHVLQ